MKATHPLSPEDVMAYLDGEVTGDEARIIQTHLAACSTCQQLAADMREGSRQMRDWHVEEPPSSLVAPASHHRPSGVDATRFKGLRGWTLFARRPLVAGAAAIVIVITGIATLLPARKSTIALGSSVEPSQRVGGLLRAESIEVPELSPRLGLAANQGGASEVSRPDPAVQTGPRIVRTATLRIVVSDFSGVRAAIDRILQSNVGFVGTITGSDRPGATRSIRATLRVPSARFDAALAALRGLGRVTEDSQNAEDVTATVVDLDVRISNARATEKRLNEVLQTRAGRLSDVLEVEREIMRVRTEIEQMESQRTQLDGRIEYATLTLDVTEERAANVNLGPIPIPTRLRQAVADGVESAATSMLEAMLFMLRGGPLVVLWVTVLGLPTWWLLRKSGLTRRPADR